MIELLSMSSICSDILSVNYYEFFMYLNNLIVWNYICKIHMFNHEISLIEHPTGKMKNTFNYSTQPV